MTRIQRTMLAGGALTLGFGMRHYLRQRRACHFAGRSVLISGGSRGLGLLLAEQFAREGALVTIAARDRDELMRAQEQLLARGLDVACAEVDVSQPDQAQQMVLDVVERTGRIDVLINNAGVIKVGPLVHMAVDDFEEAMAVHFWAALHAMLAAVPRMRAQRFGRIVNVASVGGVIGVPHLAPYSASKFALVGLSDVVRAEIACDDIRVTTVTPGLMRTGSPYNAWFKGRHREEFRWFVLADSLPLITVSGESAAAQIVDACRHGDPALTIGWAARLATRVNALAPRLMASVMALVDRFALPSGSHPGFEVHSGWQSVSEGVPSTLTRLTDRAARENNELPTGPYFRVP